jgi:hypothetical protein
VSARHRAPPASRHLARQRDQRPARQRDQRPARRGTPGIAVAAARHLAGTMPWGVLIASCAVGLGVSLAAHQLADSLQQPAIITLTARAAFVPVVGGITFLAAEPHRPLTASLPAPAWLTTAVHLMLALPLLGLTAWIQLLLAAADLGAIRQSQHLAAQLPWAALGTELGAWSAAGLPRRSRPAAA